MHKIYILLFVSKIVEFNKNLINTIILQHISEKKKTSDGKKMTSAI